MTADTTRIIVGDNNCDTCGTDRVEVYHERFPELRVAGSSAEQAAQRLADQLTSNLNVADPLHRDPVGLALADVQAFLARENAARPA